MKEILKYQIILLLGILFFPNQGHAQDNGLLIYGTITTHDGEAFTGFMRWGKEEMYWHDIFNSVKTDNFKPQQNIKNKKPGWRDMDWSFSSLWKESYQSSSHTFACFFGDISSMHIKRGDRVVLEFKNGAQLEVDGGSNDVGARIRMHDYELGKITFDWDDLKHIRFHQAPSDREPPYGKALYGTVYTNRKKQFTGHIKWDLDERNGKDILDGESRHGDQKIPFEKIIAIDKIRGGEAVDLEFESGRKMEIDGSNDCDSGNRGIAVFMEELGSIEVEWEDFLRLELTDIIPDLSHFDMFKSPRGVDAEIITYDGVSHIGHIAFDKDEIWDFEFIDGDDDDIEYQIPIRNIKRIKPKNRSFSMVELRNGEQLLLGDRQDVSYRNDGVLIFRNSRDVPMEIDWSDIEEIIFK